MEDYTGISKSEIYEGFGISVKSDVEYFTNWLLEHRNVHISWLHVVRKICYSPRTFDFLQNY